MKELLREHARQMHVSAQIFDDLVNLVEGKPLDKVLPAIQALIEYDQLLLTELWECLEREKDLKDSRTLPESL